jgi:alanyl aminopeptidase
MPNADGAGYYRWTLGAEPMARLAAKLGQLSAAERLSFADALLSGFASGRLSAGEVLPSLEPLAAATERSVAEAPMEVLAFLSAHVVDDAHRAAFERFSARLYAPQLRRLGFVSVHGESEETARLRGAVVGFVTGEVRDTEARREALMRARRYVGFGGDGLFHPDAVDPSAAAAVLVVGLEEAGEPFMRSLLVHLDATTDPALRGNLISAFSGAENDAVASLVRERLLTGDFRPNEILGVLGGQLSSSTTRDGAWQWMTDQLDALLARIPEFSAAYLPQLAEGFCDRERAAEARRVFEGRIARVPGGPRNLASALESVELCAARVDAQRDGVLRWLASRP